MLCTNQRTVLRRCFIVSAIRCTRALHTPANAGLTTLRSYASPDVHPVDADVVLSGRRLSGADLLRFF